MINVQGELAGIRILPAICRDKQAVPHIVIPAKFNNLSWV
jgi:hypothetical protein